MSEHPLAAAHRRAFTLRRALPSICLLLGGAVLLAASTGVTSAAFLQTVQASGSYSGAIDVTIGTAGDSTISPGTTVYTSGTGSRVVATLPSNPVGDPVVSTTSFPVDLRTRAHSAAADTWMTISNISGVSSEVWSAFRFGVYVGGAPVLPAGTPLSAAEIANLNGGRGASLGRIPANGGSLAVTIKVWLDYDAPAAAYSTTTMVSSRFALAFTGETVAGETFTTEVTYS